MPTRPDETRRRIVDTAERLFAERGIDGVSLREINAAAGLRSVTAVQYHFTDRDGLVRAVLAKHHRDVEVARHALLDEYDGRGVADLRALSGALVRPLAAKLADDDGGRPYLRVIAEVVNRPDPAFADRSAEPADPRHSIDRWRAAAAALLPAVAVRRLHRRFTAIRITHVELARRAAAPPASDDRLFTSHLVDLVAAVLAAPCSDETERLLASAPPPSRRRAPR